MNPLLDPSLSEDDERVQRAHFDQHLSGGVVDPTPADKHGRIAAFKKTLVSWSVRHNLNEKWCRERAYNTLEEWSNNIEWLKHRYWKVQINYPQGFIAGGEPPSGEALAQSSGAFSDFAHIAKNSWKYRLHSRRGSLIGRGARGSQTTW